ncbi:hypothetical protein E2C01_062980 [Portunus trituberculatus]|uniref:Uncharacterized protein n=1 Tax=Portunus trituberculatus TaxID=210409 RepID=A0A5B7H808_PORTR|nr:hypothetical protein [Portunus trituberculatus]
MGGKSGTVPSARWMSTCPAECFLTCCLSLSHPRQGRHVRQVYVAWHAIGSGEGKQVEYAELFPRVPSFPFTLTPPLPLSPLISSRQHPARASSPLGHAKRTLFLCPAILTKRALH